jgi:inner membrane protein
MSGPNHVAGGLVITGIFASFWDINIFSQPAFILFNVIFSVLPDIDHRKSITGKLFRPIATYLDQRFGHRTITHSLLFLALLTLLASFIEKFFHHQLTFTFIIFFSTLSHFMLDMITVQGIPLFYPFKRNPCVIPGNPQMRLKGNDMKSEMAGFVIFILLGLSLIPLYKNGFWTSYNRTFGTISHVDRENKQSSNFVECDYNYIKNNQIYTGIGLVIFSDDKKLKIFQDKNLFTLSSDDKKVNIKYVKPIPTKIPKVFQEISFFSIDIDSLTSIINNKIISGILQSSKKVELIKNTLVESTSLLKFDYDFNIKILTIEDSLGNNLQDKIKLKEMAIRQEQDKYHAKQKEFQDLKMQASKLKTQIQVCNENYQKNNLQKQYQQTLSQIESFNPENYKLDPVTYYELQILKNHYQQISKTLFSGLISYPVF